MTVLELLAETALASPEWTVMIIDATESNTGNLTCDTWGRKGGSHYKDGQFSKK